MHHTPPDFVFAVKSSRYLTHMKRLTDMDRGVGRFYDSIAPLVESPKLGPVLWQLPDRFARDDERLAHALSNLPPGRHAFELRHPSWFAEPVFDLLRSHGAAFVIHDDKRRRETPEVLTADFTYLRFHYGRRGHRGNYSDTELAGVGFARARARARGGCLRVLQQRLGGLRPEERKAIASLGKLTRCAAGWSSQVARRAHNPKVAGSNPAPAIRKPPLARRLSCLTGPKRFESPGTNRVPIRGGGAKGGRTRLCQKGRGWPSLWRKGWTMTASLTSRCGRRA